LKSYKIKDLISEKISGEWGIEPSQNRSVKVLRTTNFTNSGKINYDKVVLRDIDNSLVEKKKLKLGDIIIEKSGGSPKQPVGRVVFFDAKSDDIFLCNNFTAILRPQNTVFPKFLFYSLFYNHLIKKTLKFQNKTTGILNLQLERYLNEKVTIPSLPEQKRIADLLDKVDSVRQKRKESITLLDELLRSMFLDMFGDPVRNEKGWEKKQFKSIVEDYDYGLSNKADEDNTGIPMLRMNNITYEGRIDISKLKYINKSKFDFQKYKLIKNDFLFNRTNSPELVGKCSVWNSEQEITFAGYLIRFRFVKNIANPYFVSHYFNSSFGKKFLYTKARPSINMSNISASTLMGFPILIPPIKLQTQFAKIVEQVEVTKAGMEESLREMDNQFEGLMQKAFVEDFL